MTEDQLRQLVVNAMLSWEGATRGSAKHQDILKTYNNHTPLARGYKVQVKDAWCATTVSAAFIKTNLTSIFPTECSCNNLIKLNQQQGTWEERDDYVPRIGDCMLYDWDDNGVGDCKGAAEHIGMVIAVSGKNITVLEGNKGSASVCGRRSMQVNGRYIRGYITPNFKSIVDAINNPSPATEKITPYYTFMPTLKYGTVGYQVKFLQTLLNDKYKCGLVLDGSFGPATRSAIQKTGLNSQGIADKQVWKVLMTK